MRRGIQITIARELNITAQYINDILADRKRAGSKLAVRLEQLTGIDRAIWVWGTPEEIKIEACPTYEVRRWSMR